MKNSKIIIALVLGFLTNLSQAQTLIDIPSSLNYAKDNLNKCSLNARLLDKESLKINTLKNDNKKLINYQKDVNIIYNQTLKCYKVVLDLSLQNNTNDVDKLYQNLRTWRYEKIQLAQNFKTAKNY